MISDAFKSFVKEEEQGRDIEYLWVNESDVNTIAMQLQGYGYLAEVMDGELNPSGKFALTPAGKKKLIELGVRRTKRPR